MILRRTPRLPEDVATHLPRGDRPLAVTALADGAWAAAGRGALLVLTHAGLRSRDPWHAVESGRWDGASRQFTVSWVDGTRAPVVLTTRDDDVEAFTTAVRERVQSSVVHSESVTLPGGATATATVRRDEEGALLSQLTARGRLRGDAEERRALDDLERRARAAVGLPT